MEIKKIIKERSISIMYQSIEDTTSNTIFGFEALARGPGKLFFPMNLFNAAQKVGLQQEIEFLCIEKALEESFQLSGNAQIFINVSPETLLKYYQQIEKIIFQQTRKVVLELSELGWGNKKQANLTEIITHLKSQGIQIALDDIGAGDRNFRNICEIPSDYIKIDRGLIEGLTKYRNGSAPHYQTALKALVTIAEDLNTKVIAEGVETPLQLKAVKDSGIHLVQGFLFSKPRPGSFWLNRREVSFC